ncbi:hypothetical protein BV25DRAFT_1238891 [Artomyces pyxidatus]|uniref:Uncharacterized protein n=1 Tax=Artomyces pyxidatus TaxID=48021 RepID=A0ACB8SPV1_9AGAM|nr:hypothetical protein BV25DRAFT_1238891 [Artomyces pyxidatus]
MRSLHACVARRRAAPARLVSMILVSRALVLTQHRSLLPPHSHPEDPRHASSQELPVHVRHRRSLRWSNIDNPRSTALCSELVMSISDSRNRLQCILVW